MLDGIGRLVGPEGDGGVLLIAEDAENAEDFGAGLAVISGEFFVAISVFSFLRELFWTFFLPHLYAPLRSPWLSFVLPASSYQSARWCPPAMPLSVSRVR